MVGWVHVVCVCLYVCLSVCVCLRWYNDRLHIRWVYVVCAARSAYVHWQISRLPSRRDTVSRMCLMSIIFPHSYSAELFPLQTSSWWRLNAIQLVYNPSQPYGRLCQQTAPLTDCHLYTRSPGLLVTDPYFYAGLAELAMTITIASTHFAYPWRDGQAELVWVARFNTKRYTNERSPISVLTWLSVE